MANYGRSDLPAAAAARLSEIRASGTWGSALSTAEFAAIRSAGFEPVGQVLGAAVYNIGFAGGTECPTYGSRMSGGYGGYGGYGPAATTPFGIGRPMQPSYTLVSGVGSSASYGPLVNALYQARRTAIRRMSEECEALGGHGIVGVTLTIEQFPAGGLEFHAIGTAVRAPGGVKLRQPFTSDLSGQEFAKLIMDGAVPVSLVLGISIGVRHDDWLNIGQSVWSVGNVEVAGYTDLVNRTRQDARNELRLDVDRVGGDGVVVQRMHLRVTEQECPGREHTRDHVAEATIIGTAVTQFSKPRRAAERPSRAVLSLDPERRKAARAKAQPVPGRPIETRTIEVET